MNIDEIPITETILYRLCSSVYDQYKAQHDHKFNEGLAKLHSDVEEYLKISVVENDTGFIIAFVLNRGDIDAT